MYATASQELYASMNTFQTLHTSCGAYAYFEKQKLQKKIILFFILFSTLHISHKNKNLTIPEGGGVCISLLGTGPEIFICELDYYLPNNLTESEALYLEQVRIPFPI